MKTEPTFDEKTSPGELGSARLPVVTTFGILTDTDLSEHVIYGNRESIRHVRVTGNKSCQGRRPSCLDGVNSDTGKVSEWRNPYGLVGSL